MLNAMATLCLFVRQPVTQFEAQESLNRCWFSFFFFFKSGITLSCRLSHAPDPLEKLHQCGYIQNDNSKKKSHNCSRQQQW